MYVWCILNANDTSIFRIQTQKTLMHELPNFAMSILIICKLSGYVVGIKE